MTTYDEETGETMTIDISQENLQTIVNKVLLEVFGGIEKTAKKEKIKSLSVRHHIQKNLKKPLIYRLYRVLKNIQTIQIVQHLSNTLKI